MPLCWRIELATVLAAQFVIRGITEMRAVRSRGSSGKEIAIVLRRMTIIDALTFGFGAAYYLAVGILLIAPSTLDFATLSLPKELRWAALPLQGTGLLALFLGLRALGEGYSKGSVPLGDRLVTTGAYVWVRHPIYLAEALLAAGALLAALNLLIALPAAGMWIALSMRARREDRLLAERFGRAWSEWARVTGRILPRIGRWPFAKL